MSAASSRLLVAIPTYNEAGNIEGLLDALLDLPLALDVLVVDDASPDGTGAIVDRRAAADPRIKVLHRAGKQGIGSAHQAGIAWAYDQGYATCATMDADLTHSPDRLVTFMAVRDADVVIGTRWHDAQSLADWALHRRLLTRASHWMTHVVLGMPYDASGGFRVYHLDRIPRAAFALVEDRGYSFLWESLFILWRNGARVKEVPITLPTRAVGSSKMRLSDITRGATHLFGVRWRSWVRPQTIVLPAAARATARVRA